MPSRLGTFPSGRRSQSARSAARPRARAADSGYGKGHGGRAWGEWLGREQRGEDRLLGARCDVVDHVGHLAGAGTDGWHEQHDHRVDARLIEQQPQRLAVIGCRGGAEQVDGVRVARGGRHERP